MNEGQIRVGDWVMIDKPYTSSGYRTGRVTELVGSTMVSVGFTGYHTQYVDFNIREIIAIIRK